MKFQPGQSGNPAGRPLGARNKKTIAMEEELFKHGQEAVDTIVRRAGSGDPTCLRLLIERIVPTGTHRPLALELPKVSCADDAQVALDMVIEAFGRGEITVREFSPMLGAVDRMARVAERIQQNREREHERYKAQRVHGIHPSMIPKPTGEPDPLEPILAAIERGEDPFPDDPADAAPGANGDALYSPVNSGDETPAPVTQDNGVHNAVNASEEDGLDSPVNSEAGFAASAQEATAGHAGTDDGVYSPVNPEGEPPAGASPEGAVGEAPPSAAGEEIKEADALFFPVNSGAIGDRSPAWEERPALDDGSRLVAALETADGGREPLYVNPG